MWRGQDQRAVSPASFSAGAFRPQAHVRPGAFSEGPPHACRELAQFSSYHHDPDTSRFSCPHDDLEVRTFRKRDVQCFEPLIYLGRVIHVWGLHDTAHKASAAWEQIPATILVDLIVLVSPELGSPDQVLSLKSLRPPLISPHVALLRNLKTSVLLGEIATMDMAECWHRARKAWLEHLQMTSLEKLQVFDTGN